LVADGGKHYWIEPSVVFFRQLETPLTDEDAVKKSTEEWEEWSSSTSATRKSSMPCSSQRADSA